VKHFRLFILVSFSYFLVACSTAPTSKAQIEPNEKAPTKIEEESGQSATIAKIEAAYLATNDINARNQSFLVLANTLKNENNCVGTNIIIKHLQTSLQNPTQQAYANLLKAECALASLADTNNLSNNKPITTLIETWLMKTSQVNTFGLNPLLVAENEFTARTQIAHARLLAENGQYLVALNAILEPSNAGRFMQPSQYANTLWQWYSLIDLDERRAFANRSKLLANYKTLLETIEDTSINDSIRQSTINQWLLANADSEAAINLPQQIKDYVSIGNRQNQNIAVLLPLSGRLSGQGEVIKQGILSAYYDRLENSSSVYADQASIEFIDTGSLSNIREGINLESLLPYSTIIGPLLRTHITQVQALNLSGKQQLLLNQVDVLADNSETLLASFSLSPEQEAQQLVVLMRKQNIKNPVLINDGSAITRRMNDAFVNAWEVSELTGAEKRPLQEIKYTDNNSMRIGITSALDVLQSKKRIQQLSNISPETVHSVTRNRRDIDAFVVFARPNDVELINPIIESSISLFTNEQIPVFATSYSYDHKQSKNSQRDLRNLVFVDMPWLLPEGREMSLSTSVDTLFNRPPSAFLRLFAFGYDSLALVDNLAQLSTFAHMSIKGLSGILSINQKHQLNRELASLSITRGNNSD